MQPPSEQAVLHIVASSFYRLQFLGQPIRYSASILPDVLRHRLHGRFFRNLPQLTDIRRGNPLFRRPGFGHGIARPLFASSPLRSFTNFGVESRARPPPEGVATLAPLEALEHLVARLVVAAVPSSMSEGEVGREAPAWPAWAPKPAMLPTRTMAWPPSGDRGSHHQLYAVVPMPPSTQKSVCAIISSVAKLSAVRNHPWERRPRAGE